MMAIARPSVAALALMALLATPAGAQRVSAYDPSPSASTALVPSPAPRATTPAEPDNPATGSSGAVDDPLAANGLGGALCHSHQLSGALSNAARADCALAGTTAAHAPVSHYGFDVHIDTGTLGLSSNGLLSAVQTLLLTPLWTALLWLVHAVLSIVEWAFAIDPLDAGTMGGLARGLADVRRTVTDPWMVLALCAAAIGLLYHALVRRRVAESLGGALAMAAMMLTGLWIITSPASTIGAINRSVNDAGLSTVAAISTGDPTRGAAALGDGLRTVFASAVEGPWCYLEFGDVDWCRNPARRDHRLSNAANSLRAKLTDTAHCTSGPCPEANDARRQITLLRGARSNGELFLALPANGGQRNAITDEHSLFRVLCGSDDDSHCRGPTAGQATWRTEDGTWPRAGGLLLITGGVIGMLALLGFVALRLLGAAILTVVFLLLAPVAVLAPALGQAGRDSFTAWVARLFGALLSKLIYAVLLGVILVVLRLLESLGTAGWWTQWLLVACFWWIVFMHRHQVIAFARLGHADHGPRGMRIAGNLLAARQVTQMASGLISPVRRAATTTASGGAAAVRRGHETVQNTRAQRRLATVEAERERALETRGGQVNATLGHEQRDARALVEDHPRQHAELAQLTGRRDRLRHEAAAARQTGDHRRATELAVREARLEEQIDERRHRARDARETLERADRARHGTGDPASAVDAYERGMLLDAQSRLRRGVPPGPRADPAQYRDYARLAGVAGVTPRAYERSSPGEQRRLRAEIDRAIADRPAGEPVTADDAPRSPRAAAPETDLARRRRQFGLHGRRDD